jgi:hypothetical protein
MRSVVLGSDSAEVVSSAGSVVAVLRKGDEFTIKKTARVDGRPWTTVQLPSGVTGFLLGDVPVRAVEEARLAQTGAAIRQRPEEGAPATSTLAQGALFWILDRAGDSGGWMRVRDEQGNVGYLDARTRFVKTSGAAGALFAVRTGFVAGAIFGVVQLFKAPQTWRMVVFAFTFMPILGVKPLPSFGIKPLLSKVLAILAYLAGMIAATVIAASLFRR